jgi:hypothetical protein
MNTINIYADDEQHVTLTQTNFYKAIDDNSEYVGDDCILLDPIMLNRRLIILSSMIGYCAVKATTVNFGFVKIPKKEAEAIEKLNKEFFDEKFFDDIPFDTNSVHIPISDWNKMTSAWGERFKKETFREKKIELFSFTVNEKVICLVPANQMIHFFKRLGMKAMTEDAAFFDKGTITVHRIGKKVTDDFDIIKYKIEDLETAFKLCIDKL